VTAIVVRAADPSGSVRLARLERLAADLLADALTLLRMEEEATNPDDAATYRNLRLEVNAERLSILRKIVCGTP
jgi:hypothetical protein